jgi:hypothetical protein
MAFFSSLAKALGLKRAPRQVKSDWLTDLIDQTDATEPLEAVLRALRVKWLERSFDDEDEATRLVSMIIPHLDQVYPATAGLHDLLPGAFTYQKEEYFTDARVSRAQNYHRQKQWPVETALFLSNYYLQNGQLTRSHCFLYRELAGPAGPFVTAELFFRYHLLAAILHDRALDEGDQALGSHDAVTSAELAFENSRRSYDIAEGLAERLQDVVGQGVAVSVADDLKKSATERLERIQKLVCMKAARAGPDFASVARCQFSEPVPDVKLAPDIKEWAIKQIKESVVEVRCEQSDGVFYKLDRGAQLVQLADFEWHLAQINEGYDGYLPLRELDAEVAALAGDWRKAAEGFGGLCKQRSQSAYYAYRAGLALRTARDADGSRYLIHASRQRATRWRDEIASARAAVVAYEYEGAALRDVFPERRAECAAQLADRLEEQWERASPRWDLDTAARLAVRISHLRHLAFELTPAESQEALVEGVVKAYARTDKDGHAQLRHRAPEAVFDAIPPLRDPR